MYIIYIDICISRCFVWVYACDLNFQLIYFAYMHIIHKYVGSLMCVFVYHHNISLFYIYISHNCAQMNTERKLPARLLLLLLLWSAFFHFQQTTGKNQKKMFFLSTKNNEVIGRPPSRQTIFFLNSKLIH